MLVEHENLMDLKSDADKLEKKLEAKRLRKELNKKIARHVGTKLVLKKDKCFLRSNSGQYRQEIFGDIEDADKQKRARQRLDRSRQCDRKKQNYVVADCTQKRM